jgi:hypothetical protein
MVALDRTTRRLVMRRIAVCLMLLTGCAHAPIESAEPGWKLLGATPDTREIQFQTTENLDRAIVTDSGARGPFVDLKRSSGKLEGTVRVDWPVDLQVKSNQIIGRFARDSYDLTLIRNGGETRATGLIRGQPVTFWLSPQQIRGSAGECRFDLVWGAGRYTGSRTCGPLGQENVTLLVPAALASWSDAEAAALLTLIVSRF